MSSSRTRYTDGLVSFDLPEALGAYVRSVQGAVPIATLKVAEEEMGVVAVTSRTDWYLDGKGVKKRTGKSGTIDLVTTIGPKEIRVAVGSRDLAKAKFVHRPGPLSQIEVRATREEWWAGMTQAQRDKWKAQSKVKRKPNATRNTGKRPYWKKVDNPDAGDGKFLLQELIGKPTRAAQKRVTAKLPMELEAEISRRHRRTK